MARLKHPYTCNKFEEVLEDNLKASPLPVNSSEKWEQFKNITETAKATLGPKKHVNQD